MAMRPDLTFWLNVRPEVAFDREFKKSQTISYWESGRDMSLSNDLFQSFIRYQSMIQREFEYLSKRHGFTETRRRRKRRRREPPAAQAHRVALGIREYALQALTRTCAPLALKRGRPGPAGCHRRRFERDTPLIARATSPDHIQILEANGRRCGWATTRLRAGFSIDDAILRPRTYVPPGFRDRMDQHPRERPTAPSRRPRRAKSQLSAPDGTHSTEDGNRSWKSSAAKKKRGLVVGSRPMGLGDQVQPD